MIRRTLNNMEKAVHLIMAKGYDHEEANDIAIQCFDNAEQTKNGMFIEWWINKIADKDGWKRDATKYKNRIASQEQQI